MPNGNGGPHPPEALIVTCIYKDATFANFKGDETAPDDGKVILSLLGSTEYFTVGQKFTVTFDPIKP